jgi:hypothetical protein
MDQGAAVGLVGMAALSLIDARVKAVGWDTDLLAPDLKKMLQ